MNKKLILLLFTLSIFLCGCSNDDDLSAEYYVKYEGAIALTIGSNGGYDYRGQSECTVNTENGKETFHPGLSFSKTFGPVKKGFQASITLDHITYSRVYSCNVKIYVCRGSEPFALKADNSGDVRGVSASYTIDF